LKRVEELASGLDTRVKGIYRDISEVISDIREISEVIKIEELVTEAPKEGTLADAMVQVMSSTEAFDIQRIYKLIIARTKYRFDQKKFGNWNPRAAALIRQMLYTRDYFKKVERGEYICVLSKKTPAK